MVDSLLSLPDAAFEKTTGTQAMRRLRTRYERRAGIHEVFLKLGICIITLRHVIRLCSRF